MFYFAKVKATDTTKDVGGLSSPSFVSLSCLWWTCGHVEMWKCAERLRQTNSSSHALGRCASIAKSLSASAVNESVSNMSHQRHIEAVPATASATNLRRHNSHNFSLVWLSQPLFLSLHTSFVDVVNLQKITADIFRQHHHCDPLSRRCSLLIQALAIIDKIRKEKGSRKNKFSPPQAPYIIFLTGRRFSPPWDPPGPPRVTLSLTPSPSLRSG